MNQISKDIPIVANINYSSLIAILANINYSTLIAILAANIKPKIYLELGLYNGDTFKEVDRCTRNDCRLIGVDDGNEIDNIIMEDLKRVGEVKIMTTNDFFKNTEIDNINMIFIDAKHTYTAVKKDFHNALKKLAPGGMILLHDTNPINNTLFDKNKCGTAYRMVEYLEDHKKYNIVTLPVGDEGLSIVTRKNDTRTDRRKNEVKDT